MSKTILQPANNHVIVADLPRAVEMDGITLPDNVRQQDMVFGIVVFVGSKCIETKVQDKVCYGPYAGKPIVMDGQELRLLLEEQIEAYIRTVDE